MTLGHVKLEQGHGFSAYIAPRCAGFEWEGDEGLGWYPPWMAPIMVGAAVIGAGVGAWQVTMTTYWKVGLMVVGVVMGAIGGAVIVGALINASRMITLRRRRTRFMVDGTRWRIERWRGSTLASVNWSQPCRWRSARGRAHLGLSRPQRVEVGQVRIPKSV